MVFAHALDTMMPYILSRRFTLLVPLPGDHMPLCRLTCTSGLSAFFRCTLAIRYPLRAYLTIGNDVERHEFRSLLDFLLLFLTSYTAMNAISLGDSINRRLYVQPRSE